MDEKERPERKIFLEHLAPGLYDQPKSWIFLPTTDAGALLQ